MRSLFELVVALAIALRRAEVAGLHAAAIHDDFLQHDGGINHPHLERVRAGRADVVRGFHFAERRRDNHFGTGIDRSRGEASPSPAPAREADLFTR